VHCASFYTYSYMKASLTSLPTHRTYPGDGPITMGKGHAAAPFRDNCTSQTLSPTCVPSALIAPSPRCVARGQSMPAVAYDRGHRALTALPPIDQHRRALLHRYKSPHSTAGYCLTEKSDVPHIHLDSVGVGCQWPHKSGSPALLIPSAAAVISGVAPAGATNPSWRSSALCLHRRRVT
jgi:hypothetical protein